MNLLAVAAFFVMVSLLAVPTETFAQTKDEKKDFDLYIEKSLAHIHALELNLDVQKYDLAMMHATHPIAELYDLMKPELDEHNAKLSEQLKQVLLDLGKKTGKDANPQDARAVIEDAKQVIEQARTTVVGEESEETDFKAAVIADLLESSIGEYTEGVSDGKITKIVEYQDASAFVWRSQQIYDTIKSHVTSEQADKIDKLYADLADAYEKKVPGSDIDSMTDEIKAEFQKIGGGTAKETSLLDYLGNVKSLLAEAKEQYSAGNKATSLGLVTKAYLDNFEYLEPAIAANNLQLKQSLEKEIREDLRDMIKNDAPVLDVNTKIDGILSQLDGVASIVPEFGPLAVLALVASISMVTIIGRKNKLALR